MTQEITQETDVMPPMIISVEIDGQLVRRNLTDDLKTDEAHINDYLKRAPGLTAYWNTLYEKQRSIAQRAKVSMERKRAQADARIRRDASMDNRKVTDKQVESMVTCDSEFTQAEDNYLTQHETELTLKGAVEAIKELRSTLISLSANMRSEGVIRISGAEEQYKSKFGKKA